MANGGAELLCCSVQPCFASFGACPKRGPYSYAVQSRAKDRRWRAKIKLQQRAASFCCVPFFLWVTLDSSNPPSSEQTFNRPTNQNHQPRGPSDVSLSPWSILNHSARGISLSNGTPITACLASHFRWGRRRENGKWSVNAMGCCCCRAAIARPFASQPFAVFGCDEIKVVCSIRCTIWGISRGLKVTGGKCYDEEEQIIFHLWKQKNLSLEQVLNRWVLQ